MAYISTMIVIAILTVFIIALAFVYLHNLAHVQDSHPEVSYRDEVGRRLVDVDTRIKTIDRYLNDSLTNDHQIKLLKTLREITIQEKERILVEYWEAVRREHEEDVWKFLAR